MNRIIQLTRPILLAILLAFTATATAGTWIQGGHSGGWVNPDEAYHGMFVEVIIDANSPTGLSVVVAWYAFVNGQPTWIVGIGPVVQDGDGQFANISAFVYEGNAFPPLYNPELTMEIPWGTMTIEFDGCDEAHLSWDSSLAGYSAGEADLVRLTTISDTFCNPDLGGDDTTTDDHGNFWQTATEITLKNVPVFQAKVSGEIDYPQDVDVFRITVYKKANVLVYTQGEGNMRGTLRRIVENGETDVATDEDSGEGDNFRIELVLEPGEYTIHVSSPELEVSDSGKFLLTVVVSQN